MRKDPHPKEGPRVPINPQAISTAILASGLKSWFVAERAGIEISTLKRWRSGETKKAQLFNLQCFAQVVGAKPENLISE